MSDLYPRAWLRWLLVAFFGLVVVWLAATVAGARPFALFVPMGLVMLPIGSAALLDLDGMASAWGRRSIGATRLDASGQRRRGQVLGLFAALVAIGLIAAGAALAASPTG